MGIVPRLRSACPSAVPPAVQEPPPGDGGVGPVGGAVVRRVVVKLSASYFRLPPLDEHLFGTLGCADPPVRLQAGQGHADKLLHSSHCRWSKVNMPSIVCAAYMPTSSLCIFSASAKLCVYLVFNICS